MAQLHVWKRARELSQCVVCRIMLRLWRPLLGIPVINCNDGQFFIRQMCKGLLTSSLMAMSRDALSWLGPEYLFQQVLSVTFYPMSA